MFYEEYLEIYKGYSDIFNKFLCWCISEDEQSSFARARNDVPYKELYMNLEEKEKQLAKKLIRECLEVCDDFYYVEMLGYCGDITDIPLIEGKLRVYKEKNKNRDSDFTYCIRTCKEIIKALETMANESTNRRQRTS